LALMISVLVGGGAVNADTGEGNGNPTQPSANGQRRFHCVASWGIDWNEVLGVDDADIVNLFCLEVHTGDRFIPGVLWITNTADGIEGQPVVYPDGYVPARHAPMDDFLHKLVAVRYVVQPGGLEFSFRAGEIEGLVTVGDLFKGSDQFTPAEYVKPAAALLGKLPPLPQGFYTAEVHFIMSDVHCDGQTPDRENSCLGRGDTFLLTRHFAVLP
jgi:hypothetical protein